MPAQPRSGRRVGGAVDAINSGSRRASPGAPVPPAEGGVHAQEAQHGDQEHSEEREEAVVGQSHRVNRHVAPREAPDRPGPRGLLETPCRSRSMSKSSRGAAAKVIVVTEVISNLVGTLEYGPPSQRAANHG